ncbi:hypothetical protein MMC20_003992 [Loxospora ochrophaea]|nr:hypothetical protein [Loxospora ochrophaea]
MYFSTATCLLLATAASVATGSAIVQNKCPFAVYLTSVSDTAGPTQTLLSGNGSYSEAYHTGAEGQGVSIKLQTIAGSSVVAQFEYSLATPEVYYDYSLANGDPFEADNVAIVPSDSSCPSIECPGGSSPCAAASMTKACESSADLTMTLC